MVGVGCLVREVYPAMEGLIMEMDISRSAASVLTLSVTFLQGQCHEIFDPRFFFILTHRGVKSSNFLHKYQYEYLRDIVAIFDPL